METAMSSPLLIVASTFLLTFLGLGAAGVAYAGTLSVVAGVLTLAWSQRRHAWSWSDLGLGRPPAPARFALVTVGALLAGWLAAAMATVLAVKVLGWAPMDPSRFAAIAGNTPMLLGMLAISWTTAAIGEEMLFRGFLQTRLQALFGTGRAAGLAAVLLQAVLFGLAHAYQGPTGILTTGAIGLAFGLVVLRTRSLWPVMVAHGLIDTVSMLALYAGLRP
jgi:membrane protease YdiL (CAAX protease family)